MALTPREFYDKLCGERDAMWQRIMGSRVTDKSAASKSIEAVLFEVCRICYAELRQAEGVANWITTTPEFEMKLAFLRQVGDEIKHYQAEAALLREFGIDIREYQTVPEWVDYFNWLQILPSTVERVATHLVQEHFGGDGQMRLSQMRNPAYARIMEVFRDVVVPDEKFHMTLGPKAILQYATDERTQEMAYAAFQEGMRRAIRTELRFKERKEALARAGWPEGWWRLVGEVE
ncbi:MAG: hypothetical protein HYY96_01035 [Candidatus Tectomicrobia bacterium]|nr:hypothetical protein [Candidatus Tectomicrobia bacterium]